MFLRSVLQPPRSPKSQQNPKRDESGTGRDEPGKSRDKSATGWDESAARGAATPRPRPTRHALRAALRNSIGVIGPAQREITSAAKGWESFYSFVQAVPRCRRT